MHGASGRSLRHRGAVTLIAALLAVISVIGAPVAGITAPGQSLAAGTFTDPYFREFTVFSGLVKPVTVRFAADGRAFVGEKGGVIKEFDSVADTTPTTVIDLSTDVDSYWDRGLLGLAIDPGFLAGRPYLYVYFVYDAPPGETAPVWGDKCPTPPGGTADGCVVTSHLERFTVDPATNLAVPGSRTLLLDDWCQQFPSHAGGGIAFGPDGQLYVSGGDGAHFNAVDYGQFGGTLPTPSSPITPVDPCGDPTTLLAPNPDGTPVTAVATAEGGVLRTQDVRTTGDPTGLDGTLIRINPDTALGSAGNPLAASADLNNRRIIAHGFRNPFRWTFRPGTDEVYLGDVGNQTWEEIERIVPPGGALTPTTLPNFGWPCYEGMARSSLQTLGLNICTDLYNQGASAVTPPLYQYAHWSTDSPTGPCFSPGSNGAMSSSVTGLAFYEGATSGSTPYPSRYNGALFFADYSRNCLAVMFPGAGGVPDPSTIETVASNIGHPVDLLAGPGGDLYYVDIDGGRVVRIRHLMQPIARATATPAVSLAPVTVTLDGSASSDPDATSAITAWNWDLDHDGVFNGPNDQSGQVVHWDIATPGVYPVTLQVVNSYGLTDTVDLTVDASNVPPIPVINTPAASLTWAVGDTITFSGSATDAEDGPLPASALSWDLVMMHCPADCHEHFIQTMNGVSSGSFVAPDHEYPSHLELRLTATDSHGSPTTTTVALQPKTTTVSAASIPAGVPLLVAGENRASPSVTTVILDGGVTVSAPLTTSIAGKRYRFSTWNDSPARTHAITASQPASLTATFVPDAPDTCATATATSASGRWAWDYASGNGDVDWFRFTLTSRQRVVITLGNLGVDGHMELYAGCSTRLAVADQPGTHFEEMTRVLSAGTYRVRVTANRDAESGTPYGLRFRPMPAGIPVKSFRAVRSGSTVRLVGEVLNNTGTTRGLVRVTATFWSSTRHVVARLTASGFAPQLRDGYVTPFVITGSVPTYASVTFAVTSPPPPAVPSLAFTSLTFTPSSDGTVTERGSVRNVGTRTARSVTVAKTWYDVYGGILDMRAAALSPSTLAAGGSGSFVIVRPVLPLVGGMLNMVRGAF